MKYIALSRGDHWTRSTLTKNATLNRIGQRAHPSRLIAHVNKPAETPAKTMRAYNTGKRATGVASRTAGKG